MVLFTVLVFIVLLFEKGKQTIQRIDHAQKRSTPFRHLSIVHSLSSTLHPLSTIFPFHEKKKPHTIAVSGSV